MPALASRGARSKLNSLSTISSAIPKMKAVTRLRSTEPIASARCRRRSGTNCSGSTVALGIRSRSGRSMVGTEPSVVVRTSRLIVRCSAQRAAMASSRIRMTRSGFSTIQ